VPLEIIPMLESPDTATDISNLRFNPSRKLSDWLVRLRTAEPISMKPGHSDAVQFVELGNGYIAWIRRLRTHVEQFLSVTFTADYWMRYGNAIKSLLSAILAMANRVSRSTFCY
jgi:adenine-specific DNA methylase